MLEKISLEITVKSLGDEGFVKGYLDSLVSQLVNNKSVTAVEAAYRDYRVSYKKG